MRRITIAIITLVIFFLERPGFAAETSQAKLSTTQIEELVAPIALYPDPLLGLMLPASVFPEQIIDAALLVKTQSDAELISVQTWDVSVKGIATYPGILKMMFDELAWTTRLGQVFLNQRDELRDAIQNLRLRAQAVGNLKSTSEQYVSTKQINGESIVVIEPTQPEVVYVPQYNTTVVYSEPAPPSSNYLAPLATFGLGMALGAAMNDDDDDVYVYGGYPGRVAWYDDDSVDDWMENRQDRLRDAQEHRQDMRKDRSEFRQDRIESGNYPNAAQRQEAAKNIREQRGNTSTDVGTSTANRNMEARKQQAQQRSQAWKSSTADRGYSSGSAWARSPQAPARNSSVSRSTFGGYNNRATTSAYSSRGSMSRSSSGFRGGGMSRGGGGGRGGGGRR